MAINSTVETLSDMQRVGGSTPSSSISRNRVTVTHESHKLGLPVRFWIPLLH